MLFKILVLAIEALLEMSARTGNSAEFSRDLDRAIKSLEKVKQYF